MEKYIKPICRIIKLDQTQLLNAASVTYKGNYSGSTVIIGAKSNDDDCSEWDEEE
jgi:hypothetical protein